MTTISNRGTIDKSSLLVGRWDNIDLLPFGSLGSAVLAYHMGAVEDAVLEITRDVYRHMSSKHPRIVDLTVPIRSGINFKGNFEEIHRANLHAVISDAINNSSNYIYPGAQQCSQYLSVRGRRIRACDAVVLEFVIFKSLCSSPITVGGADEAVKIPFDFEALDDTANDSGQGGSASAPLGYLWVPTEAAATTAA